MRAEVFRGFKLSTALMILHALSRGEAHGYEIMRRIEEEFSLPKSPGILYPMLRRLLRLGYIDVTGSVGRGRRVMKVYRLTEKGAGFLRSNEDQVKRLRNLCRGLTIFEEAGGRELREALLATIEVLPRASEEDLRELSAQIGGFVRALEVLRARILSR